MFAKIKLETAFAWTCPNCDHRNFEEGVIAELASDEQAEMRWQHGIDEFQTGDWFSQPTEVTCSKCATEFPVQGMDDGD